MPVFADRSLIREKTKILFSKKYKINQQDEVAHSPKSKCFKTIWRMQTKNSFAFIISRRSGYSCQETTSKNFLIKTWEKFFSVNNDILPIHTQAITILCNVSAKINLENFSYWFLLQKQNCQLVATEMDMGKRQLKENISKDNWLTNCLYFFRFTIDFQP